MDTRFLIVSLLIWASFNLFGQTNCPDTLSNTNFAKLMDLQFAEDYKSCILKTEAVFIGTGNGGYLVPKEFDKHVIFRCYPEGQTPSTNQLNGTIVGNFCFIDKNNSDILFQLKTGSIIQLIGKVVITDYYSYKQTNFVAEKVLLINK